MKKTAYLISALLISLLIFCTPALAGAATEPYYDASLARVVDEANLLSTSEEKELAAYIAEITQEYGVDLVILTNNSLNGKSAMEFSDDYYDYNGYGVGDTRDGMLFLLSMNTRDYWTSTTGNCINRFSDADIQALGDTVLPSLKSGNYYTAFSDYIYAVENRLRYTADANGNAGDYSSGNGYIYDNGNDNGNDIGGIYDNGGSSPAVPSDCFRLAAEKLPGILIAALIISAVIILGLRSKMKPVKLHNYAGEYVDANSFTLTNQNDTYLFTTTTRKRVQKQSTTSGGGGSSTHVGSSGTSHGGGGGKF